MANSQRYTCHSMMQGSNENIKEIIGILSILLLFGFDSNLHYTTQYTPHRGIEAINKMMEETGTYTLLKMFISNLTYQVLAKNYFNFNDQLFEQKQGTAMGTRIAPNYAIIFMHYLGTNFLTSYTTPTKILLRFID